MTNQVTPDKAVLSGADMVVNHDAEAISIHVRNHPIDNSSAVDVFDALSISPVWQSPPCGVPTETSS